MYCRWRAEQIARRSDRFLGGKGLCGGTLVFWNFVLRTTAFISSHKNYTNAAQTLYAGPAGEAGFEIGPMFSNQTYHPKVNWLSLAVTEYHIMKWRAPGNTRRIDIGTSLQQQSCRSDMAPAYNDKQWGTHYQVSSG